MTKNTMMKKKQRFVNRLLRDWNRSIKNDPMYKGCFKIVQRARFTVPYHDGSGDNRFLIMLDFMSTKTGELIDTSDWIEIFAPNNKSPLFTRLINHEIFSFINDAIVIKANFWENKKKWL